MSATPCVSREGAPPVGQGFRVRVRVTVTVTVAVRVRVRIRVLGLGLVVSRQGAPSVVQ